jgi:hypothetical protein
MAFLLVSDPIANRGHILLKAQLIRLFTNYFLPPAACLQIISSPGRYQA